MRATGSSRSRARPARAPVAVPRLTGGWVGAAFLAVLVYSGQIKTLPALAWLPVDLTIASGGIVALSIVAGIIRARWIDARIHWMLGLWVLFLVPCAAFAPNGYGLQKVLTLFTFTLLCAIGPFVLLRTDAQRRVFLLALVVIGAALSALSLAGGLLTSHSGTAIDGLNPIGVARAMASGAVIMLFYGLTRGRAALFRWLWLAAAASVTLLLFASGRRGPLLALVIAVAITVALAPAFRAHRGRSILLAVGAGAVALWAVQRTGSFGAQRIFDLLGGDGDASTEARTYIWGEALELIPGAPLGIGWGQFPLLSEVRIMTSDEGRMYPHNLVLEVFVEAGWLAGLAVLAILVVAMIRSVRGAIDSTATVFLALGVYAAVNAMVSGDINDQRLLWVALAVALMTRVNADPAAAGGHTALRGSAPSTSQAPSRVTSGVPSVP